MAAAATKNNNSELKPVSSEVQNEDARSQGSNPEPNQESNLESSTSKSAPAEACKKEGAKSVLEEENKYVNQPNISDNKDNVSQDGGSPVEGTNEEEQSENEKNTNQPNINNGNNAEINEPQDSKCSLEDASKEEQCEEANTGSQLPKSVVDPPAERERIGPSEGDMTTKNRSFSKETKDVTGDCAETKSARLDCVTATDKKEIQAALSNRTLTIKVKNLGNFQDKTKTNRKDNSEEEDDDVRLVESSEEEDDDEEDDDDEEEEEEEEDSDIQEVSDSDSEPSSSAQTSTAEPVQKRNLKTTTSGGGGPVQWREGQRWASPQRSRGRGSMPTQSRRRQHRPGGRGYRGRGRAARVLSAAELESCRRSMRTASQQASSSIKGLLYADEEEEDNRSRSESDDEHPLLDAMNPKNPTTEPSSIISPEPDDDNAPVLDSETGLIRTATGEVVDPAKQAEKEKEAMSKEKGAEKDKTKNKSSGAAAGGASDDTTKSKDGKDKLAASTVAIATTTAPVSTAACGDEIAVVPSCTVSVAATTSSEELTVLVGSRPLIAQAGCVTTVTSAGTPPTAGTPPITAPSLLSNRIGKCIICENKRMVKYMLMVSGSNTVNSLVCSDVCLNNLKQGRTLSGTLPRCVPLNTPLTVLAVPPLQVNAPAASVVPTWGAGTAAALRTPAAEELVVGEENKCTYCSRDVLSSNVCRVVWETGLYCSVKCTIDQQKKDGASCVFCKTHLAETALGKYCVRFGADVRQFCSTLCLDGFKKRLKVCSYCQRDITKFNGSFLAPVSDATAQFKEFCSQKCLTHYKNAQSSTKAAPIELRCSVCLNIKPALYRVVHDQEENPKALCSEPCLKACKFALSEEGGIQVCAVCDNLMVVKPGNTFSVWRANICTRLCSQSCSNVFVLTNRRIVTCRFCKVKKYNFDMMDVVSEKDGMYCSVYCLLNSARAAGAAGAGATVLSSKPATAAPPAGSVDVISVPACTTTAATAGSTVTIAPAAADDGGVRCNECKAAIKSPLPNTNYSNVFCRLACLEAHNEKLGLKTVPASSAAATRVAVSGAGISMITPDSPLPTALPATDCLTAAVAAALGPPPPPPPLPPASKPPRVAAPKPKFRTRHGAKKQQAVTGAVAAEVVRASLPTISSVVSLAPEDMPAHIPWRALRDRLRPEALLHPSVVVVPPPAPAVANRATQVRCKNRDEGPPPGVEVETQTGELPDGRDAGTQTGCDLETTLAVEALQALEGPPTDTGRHQSVDSSVEVVSPEKLALRTVEERAPPLAPASPLPSPPAASPLPSPAAASPPLSAPTSPSAASPQPSPAPPSQLDVATSPNKVGPTQEVVAKVALADDPGVPELEPASDSKTAALAVPDKEPPDPSKVRVLPIPIPVPFYIPVPMAMYNCPYPVPAPLLLPVPVPLPYQSLPVKANGNLAEEPTARGTKRLRNDSGPASRLSPEPSCAAEDPDDPGSPASRDDPGSPASRDDNGDSPGVHAELPSSAPRTKSANDDEAPSRQADSEEEPDEPRRKRVKVTLDLAALMTAPPTLHLTPKPGCNALRQTAFLAQTDAGQPCSDRSVKYTWCCKVYEQFVRCRNSSQWEEEKEERSEPMEPDLMTASRQQLCHALTQLTRHLRRPGGEQYPPDLVLYILLGVQMRLAAGGREDRLFSDREYAPLEAALAERLQPMVDSVHSVLGDPLARELKTHIEEEMLWDAKLLGAHSPVSLLATVLYFIVKHFGVLDAERLSEMKFSMLHVTTLNKRGGALATCIRLFTDRESVVGSRKKQLSIWENTKDVFRCPVKYFEFYMARCPKGLSAPGSRSHLLLSPCDDCQPDSSAWFSAEPLPGERLRAILAQLLTVRQLQAALLTAVIA